THTVQWGRIGLTTSVAKANRAATGCAQWAERRTPSPKNCQTPPADPVVISGLADISRLDGMISDSTLIQRHDTRPCQPHTSQRRFERVTHPFRAPDLCNKKAP